MATALYFSTSGEAITVSFNEDEYIYCKLTPTNKSDIQIYDKREPRVVDLLNGNNYNSISWPYIEDYTIEISIDNYYSTTQAKILSLFDYYSWSVYYQYITDNTKYQICVLDQTWEKTYYYGERARIISNLKLYPSIS